MSESLDAQVKSVSRRDDPSDRDAIVQVEKWMAMIREISRERRDDTELQP